MMVRLAQIQRPKSMFVPRKRTQKVQLTYGTPIHQDWDCAHPNVPMESKWPQLASKCNKLARFESNGRNRICRSPKFLHLDFLDMAYSLQLARIDIARNTLWNFYTAFGHSLVLGKTQKAEKTMAYEPGNGEK